jgi:hypothetical protein
VATTGVFGLLAAPRATRALASLFDVLAGPDVLSFAYAWLQED